MSDKTYNGWTNYATWRVNLEIFDGIEHDEMFDLSQESYDLGHDLKAYAEELIDMSFSDPNAPNLARDYALAYLHDVDWHGIAKHMIADYADEVEA